MSSRSEAIVLVTPRSYRDADPEVQARLESAVAEVRYNERGRALGSEELAAELGDVDGVIAGLDRFDEAAIASAPRLRVISRYGVGIDNVDLAAARRGGVVVTNTPNANAVSVAEFTLGLMLALLRRLTVLDRRAREGDWTPERGAELAGNVVGVLGLGRIGTAVAVRANALGAEVLAHDPYREPKFAREVGAELVELSELLPRARILSLHVPVTEETRDIVDADLLAALPHGALLVNTARGELVIEDDLAAALDAGSLAGAALDSLRAEPPPPDHPLLHRDDVVITPHAAAQTAEARAAMARAATEDLLAVLEGEQPRHPVATPAGAKR
jgi:D-3-phosphoglycerate dehydrogenase / 2-oxoglutarate reductase